MRGVFVSSCGTGEGKTLFACGLASAARQRDLRVAAVKPVETGCDPRPEDAERLARASDRPPLAAFPGFYRAAPPLAPYAVALGASDAVPPSVTELAACVERAAVSSNVAIAEGAGGLLTPLSETETVADLCRALGWPLVLVARDRLGVLSHLRTAAESARARNIDLRAVVLVRLPEDENDPSQTTNAAILSLQLPCAVTTLPTFTGDFAPIVTALGTDPAFRWLLDP